MLARSPFCINDFQGVFRPKRVLSPLEEENNLAPPCPWRKLECQLPNAQMSHYKHNSNRSTKIYVYNIYRWIHIDEYIRTCLDGWDYLDGKLWMNYTWMDKYRMSMPRWMNMDKYTWWIRMDDYTWWIRMDDYTWMDNYGWVYLDG